MVQEKINEALAYDVEVFQNFFSASFLGIETDNYYRFVIHPEIDQRERFFAFLKTVDRMISFNGLFYDAPMLLQFMKYKDDPELLNILYATSQRLIAPDSYDQKDLQEIRWHSAKHWRELDLMKMMAFDKLGVGLKQVAINLRWGLIQDLPYSFDSAVTYDQIENILDYNLNDVKITKALFMRLRPEIRLRREIGNMYGVDVTSASDSKMANVILESMMRSSTNIETLRPMRTKREIVRISECIPNKVQFKTPELQKLLEELKEINVYRAGNFQYQKKIRYENNVYRLGVGGLHTEDLPADFRADDETIIRDADVASYYPSIMLNHDIRPAHLDGRFSKILRQMTEERLKAKKSGDNVKAAALKITINSVFGKLNSETFWLEDAKAFMSVTIAGQLYLLMLIESLSQQGISVISANTDGIISKFSPSQEATYIQVCEDWQNKTNFSLEMTDYERYVRRDVNNYLATKKGGKGGKEKGVFAEAEDLKKGYKMPILQTCLKNYFVEGVSVDQTLNNSKDILDYAISQKTGGQFQLEYHTIGGVEKLQKNNRFYVANKGGTLIKRNRQTSKTLALYSGQWVKLLNKMDETPFEERDVNLDFYRKEVMKIVDLIEPSIIQMRLF